MIDERTGIFKNGCQQGSSSWVDVIRFARPQNEGYGFAPIIRIGKVKKPSGPSLTGGNAQDERFSPHYARDVVARSWRWSCHRTTTGART
jgi:hypothetical protein